MYFLKIHFFSFIIVTILVSFIISQVRVLLLKSLLHREITSPTKTACDSIHFHGPICIFPPFLSLNVIQYYIHFIAARKCVMKDSYFVVSPGYGMLYYLLLHCRVIPYDTSFPSNFIFSSPSLLMQY